MQGLSFSELSRLRLLQSVVINAKDAVIISEAEPFALPGPRIIYCNSAFTEMTGYSEEEVLGKTPRILQGLDTDPDSRAKIRKALANWLPLEIEMVNYKKDGTKFYVELSITPVADESGWFTHWISIQRDISERMALTNDLNRALLAAEAAAVAKSEFLANTSHEIRTPLTSILGFSSLLASERGLTDQGRRSLERVNDSSQALLAIVNDILDFSKLESGQVEIDRRTVDPSGVLREALGLFDPQADEKGLALRLEICGSLPAWVSMDDGRIRQILLNLVGNGVKFTEAGGIDLKASYDAGREYLRCEVVDSGPGVAPDRLDRLFKRFSQVDASTTRAFGGTGLGLAICKGLVEAMGGDIGVVSTPGEGACFWFELPCPRVNAPALNAGQTTEHDGERLQGLRLLVADDNPIIRELINVMLAPHGVAITDAENGEAAVELANKAPFDIILMDIRMPILDGPTAARKIREGGGPNEITPILAFTANGAEDTLSGEDEASLFDDYISKPILPLRLYAAVKKWGVSSSLNNPQPVSSASTG